MVVFSRCLIFFLTVYTVGVHQARSQDFASDGARMLWLGHPPVLLPFPWNGGLGVLPRSLGYGSLTSGAGARGPMAPVLSMGLEYICLVDMEQLAGEQWWKRNPRTFSLWTSNYFNCPVCWLIDSLLITAVCALFSCGQKSYARLLQCYAGDLPRKNYEGILRGMYTGHPRTLSCRNRDWKLLHTTLS